MKNLSLCFLGVLLFSAIAAQPQHKITKEELKNLKPSTSMVSEIVDESIVIKEVQDLYSNGQMKSSGAHNLQNKKEGKWYFFDENGVVTKVIMYKNNMFDGIYSEYYPSGQLKRYADFIEDVQNGKTVSYYEDGKIEQDSDFKNGKRNGFTILYYPNQKISLKGEFVNGQRVGKHIGYYEDGTIMEEMNYVDDKLHGMMIKYFSNGKIRQEGKLENGEPVGTWKMYDEEGNVTQTKDF